MYSGNTSLEEKHLSTLSESAHVFHVVRVMALFIVLLFVSGCQRGVTSSKPEVTHSVVGGDQYKYQKISTSSIKDSLQRIHGQGLSGVYLFREIASSSFIGGIEGHHGNITLELWDFDTSRKPNKMLWRIVKDSDKWYFEKGNIVFLKRGCCGALDKHYYYSVSTGELIKVVERPYKKRSKDEPAFIFPG